MGEAGRVISQGQTSVYAAFDVHTRVNHNLGQRLHEDMRLGFRNLAEPEFFI